MADNVHKLISARPDETTVIRQVVPQRILTFSFPFKRMGRINIGGRGTVVKLANNTLAVFSPMALTDGVKNEIQTQFATTDVRYIVALDQEHHIFIEHWHKAYPEAKVLGPDTLPAYRDKQNYFKIPQASWHLFKAKDAPSVSETGGAANTATSSWQVDTAFDNEFAAEYVDAHANKELVFLHKPTSTVIEADLLMNLPANEQMSKSGEAPTAGVLTKLMCKLMNTEGEAKGQRRMIWYGMASADREGFGESMRRIQKWQFDRLIPCHGDVIETGAKGVFEKVMAWHLERKEGQA